MGDLEREKILWELGREGAREALCGLARRIENRWVWFFTGTFANQKVTTFGARYAWERFFAWGERQGLLGIPWLLGVESSRRGTPHIHALVGGGPWVDLWKNAWQEIKEEWFRRWGIARCYPYDKGKGACWYVTKYIVSDECLDWDISEEGWYTWQEAEA